MKNFMALLKMQLNVNFGISALKYRVRRESKAAQTVFIALAVLLGVGSLVLLYGMLAYAIYAAGAAALGRPDIVLVMAFVGLQVFLLVTGIFYVLGVFFYSRDISALIPLPLRPWQVLGAKFAVVLAFEYLMALPVLLPPMLIYGIGQGVGLFYWLKALLLTLVSPALPLLVASLLAIVLMRFLNVGRRRDLLAIIGSAVAVVAIIAFNYLTQRIAGSAASDPDIIARMLASQTDLINALGRAFPPAAWATLALAGEGVTSLLYLLLYVAVSVALLALMLWLANALYYKSALRSEETAKRRKKAPASGVGLSAGGPAGPVRAIFVKELKLLLRTPAFAMNCLLGTFIIPVIIPLTLLQNDASSAGIAQLITDPANSLAVTLASAGFMLFTATINVTASTALSREGKTFWASRMIPVPPGRQVYAKFLLAMAVTGAGIVLTAAMLVLVLRVSVWQGLVALTLGLLGAVSVTVVSMLPDIVKPKLLWTNPYEAVKQNMNVLFSMLLALLLIGAEVVLTLLLAAALTEWALYAALAAALALLAFASLRALAAVSGKYYKIEV
jgi:ABC-2 type transport system permease protein